MKLVLERGVVRAFADLPDYSIALDGYVQGPAIDSARRCYSFDHHAGCVRHATRATCEQVLDALALGLDPRGSTVYVNDIDGDTVLAVWLLQHPENVQYARELVQVVGAVDAHGPAITAALGRRGEDTARAFFEGVMAPEKAAHRAKTYATCDLRALLDACLERLNRYVFEEATLVEATAPRTFEVLYHNHSHAFVVARSDDFIFDLLYAQGHRRAVACQQLRDGTWRYTVAKQSEFVVDFPVGPGDDPTSLLGRLNAREPGWGGGSTIGGGPRNADGSGSRLEPHEVALIIAATLDEAMRLRTSRLRASRVP